MVQMDSGLEVYEIYELLETDLVGEYLRERSIDGVRIEMRNFAIYAIYTVEITDEEASFIMLSIPDISIKKCDSKVNT
jgi:hypothetical protein